MIMDEDSIVVSKYSSSYFVQLATIHFGIFLILGLGVNYSINQQIDIVCLIGTFLLQIGIQLGIVYFILIKQITVSPTGIIFDYFIAANRRNIDYSEIEAIKNLRVTGGRQGRVSSCREHVIELKDGSSIGFNDEQFENYDSLKNTIYRYMIAANQRVCSSQGT
jgi:hypothetical protein